MLVAPDTLPIDLPPFKAVLAMPYTLTPGRGPGTFLAEISKRRIVGSHFRNSGKIAVPALDFCPESGDDQFDFVEAPHTGVLSAFTETEVGVIGLIRIDGSDFDFAHRIACNNISELKAGMRVTAVWDDSVKDSILAIRAFTPAPDAPIGAMRPLADAEKPIEVIPYNISLEYEHAFGPYYGRLFDEIKHNRKIMGIRVSDGELALLPPRELDDITHKRTGTWVEVKQTGTVRAMSVIYLEFIGQTQPPPYIYAEIMLDGACTRLIHNIRGVDFDKAKDIIKPGTRVRAVWGDKRTGTLADISHFELIDNHD